MSGFTKEDKLKPIITLTIYFGADTWDAPRSLKEMFEDVDESIMQFVEDYKVHLIVPNEIRDFDKFATDFGKVMKYIAVSKDKKALKELQNDEAFKSVDADTVRLLNACTNSNISISEGEEKMDMCLGLKELIEEGREEGILLTKKVYQLQRKGKSNDDIAKECDIEISQVMKILE